MRFTRSHTLTLAPCGTRRNKARSLLRRGLLTLLAGAAMLGFAHPIYGQSPMEQAIAASFPLTKATADHADIVTAGAVMTLKKDNVIMFATTAALKSSLNYKDGRISPSIQTRLAAFSLTGHPATNIVQRTYVAGEKLWLIGIQSASDGVTLQFLSDAVGDNRYAASIKFPFAKGVTPSPQQVIAQIGEVISAEGGAPAAAPAPTAPSEAPIVPPPPPGGPSAAASEATGSGWRMTSLQAGGSEAMIAGKGVSGVRSDSVVLDLSCPAGAGPTMEVRARRKAITNLSQIAFDCGAGPEGYKNAFVALDSQPEQTVNICDESSDAKGPYHFQIKPPDEWLKRLVTSPGSQVSIRIREDKVDNLLATFTLPADGSQIASAMESCFQHDEVERKKYLATVVVSCPKIPGKAVSSIEVLTATGKPYHSPEEDDLDDSGGHFWALPKPTKAHPAVPKLTLKCSYGNDGAFLTAATVRLVPIPTSARACSFQDYDADCTR